MSTEAQDEVGLPPDPLVDPLPIPKDALTGYVVIVLDPSVPPGADADDLLVHADRNDDRLAELRAFLLRNERPATFRVVTSVSVAQVLQMEEASRGNGVRLENSLTRFWRIDARRIGEAEEVAAFLRDLSGIVHAYAETKAVDPAVIPVTPADEDEYKSMAHLKPAPDGVGAEFAWARIGGAGEHVMFVDIEQGWQFDHPDLVAWGVGAPVVGASDPANADHGTAVLDIVVGLDNASGGIGLAPQTAALAAAAHRDPSIVAPGDPNLTVANAIVAAVFWLAPDITKLAPGHVILLEVQRPYNNYGPAETDDADFTAIKNAVGRGIVVVEAAGNGRADVDALLKQKPTGIDRGDGDSWAIIVAGSNSDKETDPAVPGVSPAVTGHRYCLDADSNYGSRVDCYAWAKDVLTASAGGGYKAFAGTSSASAIIAGVAVVVQGMQRAATGIPLRSQEMRDLLKVGATPQVPVASRALRPIGVMPDLKLLAEKIGAPARDTPDADG